MNQSINNKAPKPPPLPPRRPGPKVMSKPKPIAPKNNLTGKNRQAFQKLQRNFQQASVAAAYSTALKTTEPQFFAARDQVRIIHREQIGSVTGSVLFTVANTFPLNPGLSASFPWLASQAQGWERYRFNRLRFCYYTRTGSNIPGSVILAPDYDATDVQPASEQIASSYKDTEEDAPWKDIECELTPSAMNSLGPDKFIRSGAITANQNIANFDSGNLFLCTVDGTAVSWGKLWVEYDVTLRTPQLIPSGGGALAAQFVTSTNPTTASMLANPVIVNNSANIVSIVGEVLTFNIAGQFIVSYQVITGTSATQTGAVAIANGGSILYQDLAGSTTTQMNKNLQCNALVGSTLTYNNTLVGGTSAVLIVSQVPSNMGTL